MNILHVNLAKGFRGGERQTVLLIKALAFRRNLQQTLVCRRDSPLRDHLAGVAHLRIVTANHQLAGHRAAGQVDIVHAHEAKAVHWASLHYLLKGIPYVITRRVDTPVKDRVVNRWCYRRAARRVAISHVIQRQLVARQWGDVDLVPSALSGLTSSQETTQRFRMTFPGKFLVGHAGALVDRHKGQRILLEAARSLEQSHPDIHVVFLGDGEDRDTLQQESADLSNVTWLGFKENIGDYLAGLDAFAFPSRNEGLGSVLLDVMDVGVPIVATRVGGIPDVVRHEDTGLLVAPGDSLGLAEALARLHGDSALRERLVRRAKDSLEGYTPDAMAAAYELLYRGTRGGIA